MGFYLINKPTGITSAKVTAEVKKSVNAKKAGHGGTLDPFASGLLIIATNGDTKLLGWFLKNQKTYVGEFIFGQTTETLDIDGNDLTVEKIEPIDPTVLKNILKNSFTGEIQQIPPHYSAIKVDGKKAYHLARINTNFVLKPVSRIVYEQKLLDSDVEKNIFTIEITVSSGTYIRSLARDIGAKLETIGMLLNLKRIAIGQLTLDNADQFQTNYQDMTLEVYKELNLTLKQVTASEIKMLLSGKELKYDGDEKEYIFFYQKEKVLASQIKPHIFKLTKNIS